VERLTVVISVEASSINGCEGCSFSFMTHKLARQKVTGKISLLRS
jgi:hypothetical protein